MKARSHEWQSLCVSFGLSAGGDGRLPRQDGFCWGFFFKAGGLGGMGQSAEAFCTLRYVRLPTILLIASRVGLSECMQSSPRNHRYLFLI